MITGIVRAESVTVYAAASLSSVLQELSTMAEKQTMRFSFGSSSTLAKQIAQGAPADVYFSANVSWMDFLAKENLIEPDTRVDLLGNALVIVAPKGEGFIVESRADFDFAGAFKGRLAVGDPSHVPAGIYAKEALEKLGWWAALKDRLASAEDVRGALMLVARGECAAGIVYATDAVVNKDVDVIATLPDSLLKEPVVYPVAVVKGRRTPEVDAAMRFLLSAEAAAVFRRYGFRVLMEGDMK
jgi:molybdate transport system substrate-binding protein